MGVVQCQAGLKPHSDESATCAAASRNKREVPGKHPGLCAVLSHLHNLDGRERSGSSYLLCFGLPNAGVDQIRTDRLVMAFRPKRLDRPRFWRLMESQCARQRRLPNAYVNSLHASGFGEIPSNVD
jgi:hypothetical protein